MFDLGNLAGKYTDVREGDPSAGTIFAVHGELGRPRSHNRNADFLFPHGFPASQNCRSLPRLCAKRGVRTPAMGSRM
jgi:hypothetical protein